MTNKVALVTGASRRIGATIAQHLHHQGYQIALHYRRSSEEAEALSDQLNQLRENSAITFQADLADSQQCLSLASRVLEKWKRLDLLVNNASDFYPTPIGQITSECWDDLFSANAKAPLELSQAFTQALTACKGNIVNIVDIHAKRPLKQHTVYCMAKAALVAQTQSLAIELAPNVRVNGIAPGAIIWPEGSNQEANDQLLSKVPLGRVGSPEDIANTVLFFTSAPYITGQILAVDGGASLV